MAGLDPQAGVIPASRPGLDEALLLEAVGAALRRRRLEAELAGNLGRLDPLVPQLDKMGFLVGGSHVGFSRLSLQSALCRRLSDVDVCSCDG
jgi:hypothetical protein